MVAAGELCCLSNNSGYIKGCNSAENSVGTWLGKMVQLHNWTILLLSLYLETYMETCFIFTPIIMKLHTQTPHE